MRLAWREQHTPRGRMLGPALVCISSPMVTQTTGRALAGIPVAHAFRVCWRAPVCWLPRGGRSLPSDAEAGAVQGSALQLCPTLRWPR